MELMSIMRIVATGTVVAGSLVAFAPAASAQATGPATECAAGGGASYQRCALWLDGRRVRRGADGAVVGEPGFFSPLRLTRLVEGDSAVMEARRFERNSTTAGVFGLLSALSLAGAWIVVDSYECRRDPTVGVCTTSDDAYTTGAIAFLAGGLVSGIISGVYQRRAARAANRAVFWHNSNFAR
jgi:hypothetical protein